MRGGELKTGNIMCHVRKGDLKPEKLRHMISEQLLTSITHKHGWYHECKHNVIDIQLGWYLKYLPLKKELWVKFRAQPNLIQHYCR